MGQTSKSKFVKGLEGVVAAQTALSEVDGTHSSLFYRGIPIHQLIKYSHFEEVVYWLWFGKLPLASELDRFSNDLKEHRYLPQKAEQILRTFPKTAHPMSILLAITPILGVLDGTADNLNPEASRRKAYALTAVFPTIIAAFYRIRQNKESILPDKDLSHTANFLYMMSGSRPDEQMERALDTYLILLADHGLNASTFAARIAAGTLSNFYASITSAVGTLMGELHGAASPRVMEMILEIGNHKKAERHVNLLLNEKKKVMGFGHRIYKISDPRADFFRKIARDLCKQNNTTEWFRIAETIENVMRERKKIPCNVDFFSSLVLYILGFPIDFFTTVFAASRIAGWSAHILEQYHDNRLIHPQSEYIGPQNLKYIPIKKRT